jgi:hypothetical protein
MPCSAQSVFGCGGRRGYPAGSSGLSLVAQFGCPTSPVRQLLPRGQGVTDARVFCGARGCSGGRDVASC